ncbi:Far upstream element-binding protein 2 [Auxenochlorella protothecoides]|uniref:Far upstream element-binding protein 2 n=1 Tax=Auxenochlorella protothecoides TaxID=3075 RepID=A0A087SQB3_AUXPR|nr:Far upstream element-binding protein 2 [Auxenochlorella protothecoides]KFM27917.1 Far upstream element-binding protein 2 [Auxenochlorella protothecoides]
MMSATAVLSLMQPPPVESGPGQQGYPPEGLGFPPSSDPGHMQQLVDLLGSKVPPKSTAVVECPKTMVGRVIGKGGETIKALQQYTGAMIQIDQSSDPTRVTIAGLPQALQLAVSMVNDIVRGTFKGFAMLRQIALANASSPGMATYGQQHAPVYVQGYGFVPPSQAYGGGEDPLAGMFRTSPAGPITPPISPMRGAGEGSFSPNLAAMLLGGGQVGGQPGYPGMGPGAMSQGNMSPQHQHHHQDNVLSLMQPPPVESGPGQQGYPPEGLGFPPSSDPGHMQQLVDLLGSKVPPKSTAVVECPKTMVGRVIGKGGETIKALQQYTGAMIQIDQSSDPTRVTIAGLPQALQLAVSMVNDIVRGTFKGFAMLRQIALANASSPGMATYGQQHAPVYVQGYGFVPPSQAYGGGEDPLAGMFRTSPAGPITPPISPMRGAGEGSFSPNLAAMLLGGGQVGGQPGYPGMGPGAMSQGNMSPQHQHHHQDNASTDAMLSQLLTQLSFNQQAAEAAASMQQHSPHAYLSQHGTPPGTPGSGGGGGVLDAAGLQTLLAQAALLGRTNMAGGGGPGRDGSAGGLSALLAGLGHGLGPAQAAPGPGTGSPASSSPLTGRASPTEASLARARGRSFTATHGGGEDQAPVAPSPLGDVTRGGASGSTSVRAWVVFLLHGGDVQPELVKTSSSWND